LAQSARCTETPRPRVTNPTISSPGTGLQQVTCLVHRLGGGISQAIGTGGRDLGTEVGGIAMLQGIEALAADAGTRVIVLISKPPARAVAERVCVAASRAGKPVVVGFLGADAGALSHANLHAAATLEDAAHAAVALRQGQSPAAESTDPARAPLPRPGKGRRYLRGLFSGGTFCYEACLILEPAFGAVRSNAPLGGRDVLTDVWTSRGHTLLDLGDDVFTRGRPHPMIDHRLRNERLLKEACDPEVGVILFDVVLGCGAHADPAAAMEGVLRAARAAADVVFVASVCGTDLDAQGLSRQEERLRAAGVVLAASNAAAVRLGAAIIGDEGR